MPRGSFLGRGGIDSRLLTDRFGVVFCIWILHQNSKFVAIDKEADNDIMLFLQFGETNRFAGQPFNPPPQVQVFPFDVLGVGFADHALSRR